MGPGQFGPLRLVHPIALVCTQAKPLRYSWFWLPRKRSGSELIQSRTGRAVLLGRMLHVTSVAGTSAAHETAILAPPVEATKNRQGQLNSYTW